uniref:subunit 6 of NADH-plastoquinone oxidoreductase n=1 Tax=Hormidiella parvula TaxID=2058785 RepID=UPI00286D2789|nr:subunit 6 of NADH-plastoquinone oxidoreductase [Hormidiella parvula]WKT05991.1 subunit 6 of NADH-plastoquinone oxidoreductase [Hormidiella parvula]
MTDLLQASQAASLSLVELGVLIGALGVVLAPTMVYAALCLGVTLIGVALVYLFLNADFVAAVQLLIYVGAINVLILFAIMLVGQGSSSEQQPLGYRLACLCGVIVLSLPLSVASNQVSLVGGLPGQVSESQVGAIGAHLFKEFLLPFELISLVLLVALIGAIQMARGQGGVGLQATLPTPKGKVLI